MSENKKNVNEELNNDANSSQEQLSLNDDRRVKVLSPGAMVAQRFFRNRLAVTGLVILVFMFLFSFVDFLPINIPPIFYYYTLEISKSKIEVVILHLIICILHLI